jgi:hypothetical protein
MPSYTGQSFGQSTSYAPWASGGASSVFNNAQQIMPTATPYTGPSEAAFGPQFGQASNFLSQNLGQTNPYTVTAGNSLQNLLGGINPNASVTDYMSPYIGAALAPTLQNLVTTGGQQQQQNAANATKAGAYGGTAQGVQGALLDKFLQQNVAGTTAQGYNTGYNSALQNMLGEQNLYSGASQGLGALGQNAFTQGTTLANMLAGLGQTQQTAGQTGINTAMQMAQQQATLPLAPSGQLAQILAQLAPLGGTATTGNTAGYAQQPATKDYSGYSMLGNLLGGIV